MNIYQKILFGLLIIRCLIQIIKESLSQESSKDKIAGILAAIILNSIIAHLIYKSYQ